MRNTTGLQTEWSSREVGRICATAGKIQRSLLKCTAAYPRLYEQPMFDAGLHSILASASALGAPSLDADRLMLANKAAVWLFGLDWRVDQQAGSADEVTDIVRRCRRTAAGSTRAEGDDLTRFLADIRDELAASPTFELLREAWLEALDRLLSAMRTEWMWRTAHTQNGTRLPSLPQYLDNSDNTGFVFVIVSHWISTCEPPSPALIPRVLDVADAVQRVIRLLNDQGTYERELLSGDLNALILDSRDAVAEALAHHTDKARDLLTALRQDHQDHADLANYMERQMEFTTGFYQLTDFWGEA
ncbi:terpene synthase family protein [Sinosporangium siamense]|uniref:Terpene synthase n=1 Tax=Sinosporangium siamense TaxID=1367973 RepID=A0A919RMQ3_9ACTN|nr:terpene synthase family protein [Sinosporangium siamense]GII94839.1 hypothetical protein Ssi02_50700 [Sinosporangium siamense]